MLFTNHNHILPAEYLLGIYYFGKFYLSILDWLMEGVFSFAKKNMLLIAVAFIVKRRTLRMPTRWVAA